MRHTIVAIRDSLSERFVEAMQRMSVRMRSQPSTGWIDPELTMPQAKTLFHLSGGPRRMREVASFLRTGMPSATSMIDRLVRKGLVRRAEEPGDRRVVACELTDGGMEAVERFWRVSRARAESMADALTDEELAQVAPALEVLAAAIARRDAAELRECERRVAVPADEAAAVGGGGTWR